MSDVPAQFLYDSTNLVVVGNVYNPIEVYTDSDIRSGNVFISNSLACDELSIDTMDAQVDGSKLVRTIFKPKDADRFLTADEKILSVQPWVRILVKDPSKYSYGQEVFYYHNQELVGKFYVSEVKRVGKFLYDVSCISAIGLLDSATHYGGIYKGTYASDIVDEIIGNTVPYEMDGLLKSTMVYGWLPIDTKRNNLHQLLFAIGASVTKNSTGTMLISTLSQTDPKEIMDSKIYIGGSVTAEKKVNRVIVTEHNYVANTDSELRTLYEGAVSAETLVTPMGVTTTGTLVTFNNPTHSLEITDGELIEWGANYAVISPSALCKLEGKEYDHITRQVVRSLSPETRSIVNVQDNDAVVENATLVSLLNVENIVNRVMAYYSSARKVNADIVVSDEKPGNQVAFNNAFDEHTEGFIKSMDITMSGILKANSEIVENYVPQGFGNYYKHHVIITENGQWEVPAGVTKIHAVLIGGGQGGQSGYPGETPNGPLAGNPSINGGVGGLGGNGGLGGKILAVDINVTPGQKYNVGIGVGGIGNSSTQTNAVLGQEGTATTFGPYSSENGSVSEIGYSDLIDGKKYAMPGSSGYAGKNGGGANGAAENFTIYNPEIDDFEVYLGGTIGKSYTTTYSDGEKSTAYGGYGGGAAYGSSGSDGGNGRIYTQSNGKRSARGGNGGAGGNGNAGSAPTNTEFTIGFGGNGGNGGGGGGAGGGAIGADTTQTNSVSFRGSDGQGGLGGAGGKGNNGGVIIYY